MNTYQQNLANLDKELAKCSEEARNKKYERQQEREETREERLARVIATSECRQKAEDKFKERRKLADTGRRGGSRRLRRRRSAKTHRKTGRR